MILSILTPAVPSRLKQLDYLCNKINLQVAPFPQHYKAVEHLVFIDNKARTVGEKRDALLRMARGKYVAFVDDDDDVSDDYVREIVKAATGIPTPDVITFRQRATVDDRMAEVEFRLGHPNDPFVPWVDGPDLKPGCNKLVRRNAWHICAWRRDLAILSHFPSINYGEDWKFAERLCSLRGLWEVHIPKVLHYYRHDSKTTEAPFPGKG